MNTNNAPFHVGQRVVRIGHSIPPFVKKGDTYIVSALKQCPSCGNWKVSCIGFPPTHSGRKDFCNCGGIIISDGLHFGRAEGFAPIEENRIKYVAVSETLREKAQEVVIENLSTS